MTDIEWVDEPPASRKGPGERSRYKSAFAALRANPGQWAKIATETSHAVAYLISRGKYTGTRPPGSFEAVTRTVHTEDGRKYDVYARYVGELS